MGEGPQAWSGWNAALLKCLQAAGGELHFAELRKGLVASYAKACGSAANEDLAGNAALASIPEAYLSKTDAMVRMPKRSGDDDDDEAPKAKKSRTDSSGVAESAEAGATSLKVFIKGLPYSVEEAALRKDFEECGEIKLLQLPMEEGRPKGFAFITFTTREGFDASLKYNNSDYGGRYITVEKAAEGLSKGKDAKGKGKGGRDGDWTCPNCSDNVFARNAACRQCGTARPGGAPAGANDNENKIFIRGLPFSVTEEGIRKDFAECGEIVNIKLPLNDEGTPRGIGFIKYANADSVTAAMKFDNTDYGGRTINVSKAGDDVGKGKDGKGKGKGKDGKDKGKGKKGKSKAPSASFARGTGCIVEGTGEKKTFDDSEDE